MNPAGYKLTKIDATLNIEGWEVSKEADRIRCVRKPRLVFIPTRKGKPALDYRDGFGALSGTGCTTWMNPAHVERIVAAIEGET